GQGGAAALSGAAGGGGEADRTPRRPPRVRRGGARRPGTRHLAVRLALARRVRAAGAERKPGVAICAPAPARRPPGGARLRRRVRACVPVVAAGGVARTCTARSVR